VKAYGEAAKGSDGRSIEPMIEEPVASDVAPPASEAAPPGTL